jgi:HSP20 family protein
MNLVRRPNAGSTLASLQRDLNNMWQRFFDDDTPLTAGNGWLPAMEIEEDQEELVVRAEVPGMDRDDLDISLQGNTLTISGEKKRKEETGNGGYYQSERRYGRFQRVLTLPTDVDAEKIQASQADGILTIRLPKSEASKPRKIEVNG